MDGFSVWKTERGGSDKGGGGLCIFYKDVLTPHHWSPIVPSNLSYIQNERQWLLLTNGNDHVAFLHVYIACQSHKNYGFLQWNEDLFHLITQETIKLRKQGFTILALGDFNSRIGKVPGLEGNTPDTNLNTPMFLNFVASANLIIINSLPISKGIFTRFMDGSGRPGTKALLDYGLIDADHCHTVTSFVIDANARFDAGSDHALLEAILTFGPKASIQWSFQEAIQYNFKNNTSFTGYQTSLDLLSSSIPLSQFVNLSAEDMLPHIRDTINQSGKKTFGLKVKHKKTGQRLPRSIINLIRTKNEVSRSLQQAMSTFDTLATQTLSTQLMAIKLEIKSLICDLKLKRRHKLRSKLLRADPSRRKFWSFIRNQMKVAGAITGCYDITGKMVFDQAEIEAAVLAHFETIFQGKRSPVFFPDEQPDQMTLSDIEIQNILNQSSPNIPSTKFEDEVCPPMSFMEFEQILGKLPLGKASGYDQIPNEFLKQASFHFKQYLLAFYNQIITDGKVPESLNIGKCILIYKVRLSQFKTPNVNHPHNFPGWRFLISRTIPPNHHPLQPVESPHSQDVWSHDQCLRDEWVPGRRAVWLQKKPQYNRCSLCALNFDQESKAEALTVCFSFHRHLQGIPVSSYQL